MRGSKRLEVLSESQTLALTKKVRALKKAGKDVLGLTLGEPDFDTPAHICEAAIKAIHDGFTHYPPVAGIPELRDAIAVKFNKENNLSFQGENIVVSTGAKQSIVNAIMALVDPGDEVVMQAPYWVSYLEMIKMAEAKPVMVKTTIEEGFKLSPEKLAAAITPKTKMFILNSPSNPTGTMYTADEIKALMAVLEKHPQVFILSDEIYEHLSYGVQHFSPGSIPAIADRTITVNGFSKCFAMTGWRVGYIGAVKWIAELCEKFQGQITSGTSTISQRAGLAAITGSMDSAFKMREKFQMRRDLLCKELSSNPNIKFNVPDGAFYVYPDLSFYFGKKDKKGNVIRNIDELCLWLIEEGNVAVIPGSAFGSNEHVRISFAYATAELQTAVKRFMETLSHLS